MFSPQTFIIEMTGIFGAGYLPRLFQPLTNLLRSEYSIYDGQRSRRLVTRYYIDNTGAIKANEERRERVTELIKQLECHPNLTHDEWADLLEFLGDAEGRFLADIESYPMPVDVVFRRGGLLQDHIILNRSPNMVKEIRRDSRSMPKLQIFLRADLPTIRETYLDGYIQQTIIDNPGIYNGTPEEAYAQQEEWLNHVRKFTGLHFIDRKHVTAEQYVKQLLAEVIRLSTAFGIDLRPNNPPKDIFLSHASADKESFVRPLADALAERGVRVWYDEFELKIGDSLSEGIDKGLAESRYGAIVLSKAFFDRPWPKRELRGLVARETEGEQVILPIWHGVKKKDVLAFSPSLSDLIAIDSGSRSIEEIADQLQQKLRASLHKGNK